MKRSLLPRLAFLAAPVLVGVVVWWSLQDPMALPPAADTALAREKAGPPLPPPVTPGKVEPVEPAVAEADPIPASGRAQAKAAVMALRQDIRWQAPMPETAFAEFREWTGRFAKQENAGNQAALMAEGLELAEQRRNQLADLIDQNPRRALELAVPVAVRRGLPEEIVARLEEPVAARGDFFVVAAVPAPGKTLTMRPVERSVTLRDGREFQAYTFGRRDLVPTRENIAVQGIALDGKLAMTELPGRIMEPVEVADLQEVNPVCPTSGVETASTGDEVVVDWDGMEHTFYCGPQHALNELMVAASGDEAMAGGTGGGGVVAESANTEGAKKLLIIRVDFPDKIGQVVSDATLTALIKNMGTHWAEMSFGKMSWAALGAGSDFTPTLRLPNGHASYTSFGTMLTAARTAATAAGFNYTKYTHEVVVTGDKPDVSFGGVAFVGGRGAWLANGQWNLGVCSHEVGHNFGLNHSGFWDTTDGTVAGSGSAVEYGNPFDHMGGASSSMDAHFGARQKNFLDWIPDTDVVKITANGSTTTRIRAFDRSAAAGDKTIAVDRAGTANDYWIEYRQDYTDTNAWMRDGVLLNWGDVSISNMRPLLLDWTPSTSSKDDSPLLIGRTFSDSAAGVHITPLLRGTDADGTAWIDVRVNRGTFAGNLKPSVSMAASSVNPAANGVVNFTATATDPNGDPLSYFWDWGDATFTANNSSTASKSWSTTGVRTVRCHVTDMKGLTTTGQVLVQVGTSSTFFIQGVVSTTAGALVENAVVRAGSAGSDTTDSEGYYAITGLAAGSYAMSATKSGLSIQPGSFTNPVAVGPSKQNVNLTAPPGSPYFGTMKPALLDQGSNTGAVLLPVSDADTPVTSLTLTGESSNPAIIPHASITFGTVGTTVRTVTAAAGSTVSGPVDITITATDPQGATNSYVWPVTVNAKPVLAVPAVGTPENTPVDIDLRAFVTDDLTADDLIGFELKRPRNGTVALLADGHTARFTPAPDYHGAASFLLTARDLSLSSRVQFLYDFEPPDLATDAKSTDQSNFNRTGTLEVAGVGGEYSYTSDVPDVLAPWGKQSLSLSEAGTGGARLRRTLAATDHNYNDADWTFSAWVKRSTRDTEDFIMHLGVGEGHGPDAALELFFGANSDILRLQKWGATLEKEIVGPGLPIGGWHHITLTYDRTAANTGTLALYVDGFAYGSVASVAMNVSQSASLMVGGHNSTTASLDRWLDGKVEDVLFQSGVSGRPEIWGLARHSARHYNGLSAGATINVTVSGSNQPPAISPLADVFLPVGSASAPIPFILSDAEAEARTLTVTAASSNPALLPVSGIALSAAPAAWTSGDIGTVGAAGSLIQDHGTFIIGGAGADIGPAAGDEFRWVRQNFTGDGEIIARVASMDFTNVDSKAGVMMRDSATATSPFAMACVTPGGGVSFQYRATASSLAVVQATVNAVAAPCWLRLVRNGNIFTAFHATETDGTAGAWQPLGTAQAITFPAATNAIGLAVTSKVDSTVCTAVFDQLGGSIALGGERTVTLTPAAAASGSALVTLTAGDGAATTSRTFNVVVEGSPPATSVWSAAATAGNLLWSSGPNWTGGVPPADSRFSTVEFFTGGTLPSGTVTSNNDHAGGRALNVLTLGGTGPAAGTGTVAITGNPLLLGQGMLSDPVINLSATNGTGLTYNVSAPLTLDGGTTVQGNGTAAFILSGGITGPGSLTKTGNSRLILAGAGNYAGTTTISGGILQIGNDGAGGSLAPGNVLNNSVLRFDRTGLLAVPNTISGTGSLTIDCPINAGTVVLSGNNSFTGAVTVSSGSLRITNSAALGSGAKTITLSNGSAGNPRLLLDGGGGAIDIPSGINFTTSNAGGAVVNEAGANFLRGNFTLTSGGGDTKLVANAGSQLTLTGNITPNTTGRALQLGGAGDGSITGTIRNGSATQILAVTKTDPGAWTMAGANTYSGPTTVSQGTLRLGHPDALGTLTGGTTVASGGTLDLNGHTDVMENLTLSGTGAGAGGALVNQNTGSPAVLAGGVTSFTITAPGKHSAVPAVTLSGGGGSGASAVAVLGVTPASFTITGGTTVYSTAPAVAISGGGGSGATATAILTGGVVSGITITNTGSGYTTAPAIAFSGGTVATAGTNPSGTGNATNFGVSGLTVTAAGTGYSSAPAVSFGSGTGTAATANLTGISLAADTGIGGAGDLILDVPISGAFALTKTGTGTLTLNAVSSYTGATTVSDGRLVLAGRVNSAVNVTGGTFGGSGAVTGNVAVNGGIHAPGNSPGQMSVAGHYTLGTAGTLRIEINGTAVATQYDQLKITGPASTVTLAGVLDLAAVPALAAGSSFTIIDNGGPAAVGGSFAGKPQNAAFYEDGQWWSISYTGGTGNDVVLTRLSPTPWQNWLAANFGSNAGNPAVAGGLADADGDGITNLLEYATATNPNQGNSPPGAITKTAAGFDFIYPKNKTALDLTYTVEWSDSPGGPVWSTAGVGAPAVLSDNGSLQQIRVSVAAGIGVSRRFVHLKVTRP